MPPLFVSSGCVQVGICDMGLGQPFLYRRVPGTPTPGLGYTKTPEPQRKETLICGATSVLPVLSLEGQHLSPPPAFSPFGGGRRITRCKSPVPGDGHISISLESTQEPHVHHSSRPRGQGCLTAFLSCSASPQSTTAHPFSAVCAWGGGISHFSPKPHLYRLEPFTHRAPPLTPGLPVDA